MCSTKDFLGSFVPLDARASGSFVPWRALGAAGHSEIVFIRETYPAEQQSAERRYSLRSVAIGYEEAEPKKVISTRLVDCLGVQLS